MRIRRVVTGHNANGKAVIASDEMVEGAAPSQSPGNEIHRLWGADSSRTFPDDGSKPSFHDYFPPLDGFRFGVFTVPPMSDADPTNIDVGVMLNQMEQIWPGMASHMEPDNPGMHTTDSIDYEFVISGEVFLELDDGEEVHLKAGDTVVQNGTRHAWRNKGTEPCRMVVCLIGAHRA